MISADHGQDRSSNTSANRYILCAFNFQSWLLVNIAIPQETSLIFEISREALPSTSYINLSFFASSPESITLSLLALGETADGTS